MEAALAGLPVILPPSALLAPDLVAAGAGIAVDPRDTAAFAAVLSALAASDAQIEAMSRAAFTATRHLALSPDEWIDRLLGHYAERLGPVGAAAQVPADRSPALASGSKAIAGSAGRA
jgi:glycosyltransferase involved in cell wall biosynthesis